MKNESKGWNILVLRRQNNFLSCGSSGCGERYGDAITGVKDHADYWEELRCEGKLNALDEPLRDEYFSIPRGRVVYHSDTERFFVYHGNNVKKKDLRKVASFFNLPKGKTIFEQDFHYCDFDDSEWKLFF